MIIPSTKKFMLLALLLFSAHASSIIISSDNELDDGGQDDFLQQNPDQTLLALGAGTTATSTDVEFTSAFARAKWSGSTDPFKQVAFSLSSTVYCAAEKSCKSQAGAYGTTRYFIDIAPKPELFGEMLSYYDVEDPNDALDTLSLFWEMDSLFTHNGAITQYAIQSAGFFDLQISYAGSSQSVNYTGGYQSGTMNFTYNPFYEAQLQVFLRGNIGVGIISSSGNTTEDLTRRASAFIDPVLQMDPGVQRFFNISQTAIPSDPVTVDEPMILYFALAMIAGLFWKRSRFK